MGVSEISSLMSLLLSLLLSLLPVALLTAEVLSPVVLVPGVFVAIKSRSDGSCLRVAVTSSAVTFDEQRVISAITLAA